ncbi:MAG TPA: mechanosensitive ion channel domain-containing protein, partial [Azonexus sp.]|nr:mechanosensitive ion channel domain-containing protein [Azonexus sp.]
MPRLIGLLWTVVMLLGMVLPLNVQAKPQEAPEAVLSYANREIVVLRSSVQGATPEHRVKRIEERLRSLEDKDLGEPLVRSRTVVEHQTGELFSIGDRPIFVLFEADLDHEAKLSLDAAADQVEARLKAAIAATLEQQSGPVLLKGLLRSALATFIAGALLIGIQRLTVFLLVRLQTRVQTAREGSKVRWAEHAWLLVRRIAQLFLAFLWVSVAYLWFAYVLGNFPITQPYAEKLSSVLSGLLALLGRGAISALPGMLTVAIILFLTKAVNDVIANVFENVDKGRSIIPGLHKDTAHATRRLVAVLVWAFGIAVAYPFLPLAESDAFKGLSVMFGFMLTLGSAGIVTQMMSGLVLIYSRALKVGDFVSIGDVMGVVKETGVLSTKIINMRNEEVTI